MQGWLPRSGLLYGVDYVVYTLHPAAMHSTCSVLLLPVRASHPLPDPPPELLHRAAAAGDDGDDDSGGGGGGGGGGGVADDGAACGDAASSAVVPGDYIMHDWHDLQITNRVTGTVRMQHCAYVGQAAGVRDLRLVPAKSAAFGRGPLAGLCRKSEADDDDDMKEVET